METSSADDEAFTHSLEETRRGALRTVARLGAATLAVLGLAEAPAVPAKAGKKKGRENSKRRQRLGGGAPGLSRTYGMEARDLFPLHETGRLSSRCATGTVAVGGVFIPGGVCPVIGQFFDEPNSWTVKFRCTETQGATPVPVRMSAICLALDT